MLDKILKDKNIEITKNEFKGIKGKIIGKSNQCVDSEGFPIDGYEIRVNRNCNIHVYTSDIKLIFNNLNKDNKLLNLVNSAYHNKDNNSLNDLVNYIIFESKLD